MRQQNTVVTVPSMWVPILIVLLLNISLVLAVSFSTPVKAATSDECRALSKAQASEWVKEGKLEKQDEYEATVKLWQRCMKHDIIVNSCTAQLSTKEDIALCILGLDNRPIVICRDTCSRGTTE